ncbi:MAG TPA: NTP transferase domain-containing protein [Myxococcota bacterium]|nr:NTP transferase domain-containing protein [Myxococcota bacterium]HRY95687.1 NTP transferase domain-containing protein [Myxococcota bacterium]HSA20197.1 NTP transferase domain-containing protein [Myxococcota bacterium]
MNERVPLPGLLLVGSANRGAGKTELVCRILQRFSGRFELTGVKITTIHEGEPATLGSGHDGHRAFTGPCRLSEEASGVAGKDTTRMKAAGARRVLWLRVRREELRTGLSALREALGPSALAVVESSSLRGVVDPDLFLMLERPGAPPKPTAERVSGFADRRVRCSGTSFDLDLEALAPARGRWQLREPATAIVLAGGQSRRMGIDKGSLEIGGIRLLERVVASLRPHVREVLIGLGADRPMRVAGTRPVFDPVAGQGPLMGLATCLAASTSDRNLVAACDLPDIPRRLVERLLDEALTHEAAVPRGAGGELEPLLAVYRRRLLPDVERLLATGERSIRPLYAARQVSYVELPALGVEAIPNLNTPEDVAAFEARRRRPG